MSNPRRLLPGQTHSITRRASERRFLLRPDPFVNDVLLYALARANQLHPSVAIHGVIAESNHTHSNVTDARANDEEPSSLPRFFQCMNRMPTAALSRAADVRSPSWVTVWRVSIRGSTNRWPIKSANMARC